MPDLLPVNDLLPANEDDGTFVVLTPARPKDVQPEPNVLIAVRLTAVCEPPELLAEPMALLQLPDERVEPPDDDHALLFELIPLDFVEPTRPTPANGFLDELNELTDLEACFNPAARPYPLLPRKTVLLDEELGIAGRTTRGDERPE